MVDGYEPYGTILLRRQPHRGTSVSMGTGEVYPGWWDWVGTGEGYTGTQTLPSQGPILSIFSLKAPTYGQMKVNYDCFMRFLG